MADDGKKTSTPYPSKGTKSKVWQYFEYKDENKDKATCRLCFTDVSCKTGNTSNLMSHLRCKHGYHDLSSETESKVPASSVINQKRQAQMKLSDIVGPKISQNSPRFNI